LKKIIAHVVVEAWPFS